MACMLLRMPLLTALNKVQLLNPAVGVNNHLEEVEVNKYMYTGIPLDNHYTGNKELKRLHATEGQSGLHDLTRCPLYLALCVYT